jgi:hypothetical protein
MDMPDSAPPWRFRLQLLTGLALLVLAVLWARSRQDTVATERARATLRGTLQGLVQAQEGHLAATGRYASSLDSLAGWARPGWPLVRFHASARGWSAVAEDTTLVVAPRSCGVFLGAPELAPHRAVVDEGVIACW